MGPTQSVMAWGCADEQQEGQEEFSATQGQAKEPLEAKGNTGHEDVHPHDQPIKSQNSDSAPETEQVRVNPVYELSLCPRFKELLRSGSLSPTKNEKKSLQDQAGFGNLDQSPTKSGADFDPPVVSVQPQSSVSCSSELSTENGAKDTDRSAVFQESENGCDMTVKDESGDQHVQTVNQKLELSLPNLTGESAKDPQHTAINEPAEAQQDEGKSTEACSEQVERNSTGELVSTQLTQIPGEIILPLTEPGTGTYSNASTPPDETSSGLPTTSSPTFNTPADGAIPELPATSTDSTITTPADETSPELFETTANSNVTTPADETSPMFDTLSEIGNSLEEDRVPNSSLESCENGDGTVAGIVRSNSTFSCGSNDGGAAAGAAEHVPEPKHRKTSSGKRKKKDDKNVDYVLRTLSNLSCPEEKLTAMCKKYTELHEEQRVLQSSLKQQQRKMAVVQREKDQIQSEHTKAMMAKSRLESLCRELQKQNKVVKDESILRAKEDEERRKEISAKFQKSIGEIQTQVTENHEKNLQLREENKELASKLKNFLEQHDLREQQLDKITQHRDLERQLAEAKLDQAAAILKEEQAQHVKERELILMQTTEGQKKNAFLESQLTMYKERYEEFQKTINRSNDVFQKLKSDMDKMGKRIKKLEKEGAQWKSKWETSNKTVLEMTEEKASFKKEKQTLETKVVKLESLCRALQAELHGKMAGNPRPNCNDPLQTGSSTAAENSIPSTTTTSNTKGLGISDGSIPIDSAASGSTRSRPQTLSTSHSRSISAATLESPVASSPGAAEA